MRCAPGRLSLHPVIEAAALGDTRRNDRLFACIAALVAGGAVRVSENASWAHAMACYRFYQNDAVPLYVLYDVARDAVRAQLPRAGRVYLVHDPSLLDFSRHNAKRDRVPIGDHRGRGYELYSVLALDADGRPLDPVFQEVRNADGGHSSEPLPLSARRRAPPFVGHLEQMEKAVDATREQLAEFERVHVADREFDDVAMQRGMFATDPPERYIVRAQHPTRRVLHESWVCRRLTLAEGLHERVQADVRLGLVGARVASELGRLPCGNQPAAAAVTQRRGLTVAQTARMVQTVLALPDADARERWLADALAERAPILRAAPAPRAKTEADLFLGDIESVTRLASRLQVRLEEAAPLRVARPSLRGEGPDRIGRRVPQAAQPAGARRGRGTAHDGRRLLRVVPRRTGSQPRLPPLGSPSRLRGRRRRARRRRDLPCERLVEGPAEARPQRAWGALRPGRVHRNAGRRHRHLDSGRPAGWGPGRHRSVGSVWRSRRGGMVCGDAPPTVTCAGVRLFPGGLPDDHAAALVGG